MQQRNIFQYIVQSLKNSGILGRILAVNSIVFALFLLLRLIENLFVKPGLSETVLHYFAAPGDPSELLYKPWSIFTQMITHYEFGHFFLNMLVFFFTASMFVQFFGERRLVTVYILGGLFAYLFHIGAYYTFPVFAEQTAPSIIGASGSIMAVFMAVAFYRPSLRVHLFGIIPIPIILVAVLYLWSDLSGVMQPSMEGHRIAHLAHLGGAIFGGVSIIGYGSSTHFMNRFDRFFAWFKLPKLSFRRKPKMHVYQGGYQTKNMSDAEYNYNKKMRQERLDAILDKIGKKGYEGLTKEEKDFLFNESQRK